MLANAALSQLSYGPIATRWTRQRKILYQKKMICKEENTENFKRELERPSRVDALAREGKLRCYQGQKPLKSGLRGGVQGEGESASGTLL